jgi:hypothetical protein
LHLTGRSRQIYDQEKEPSFRHPQRAAITAFLSAEIHSSISDEPITDNEIFYLTLPEV